VHGAGGQQKIRSLPITDDAEATGPCKPQGRLAAGRVEDEARQAHRTHDLGAQRLLEFLLRQAAQQVAEGRAAQTEQDFALAPGYADARCGNLAKPLVIVVRQHRLHLPMAR